MLVAALPEQPQTADCPERRPRAGEGIQPWYNHTGLIHSGEQEWAPTVVWAGPSYPAEGRRQAQKEVPHSPLFRVLVGEHR